MRALIATCLIAATSFAAGCGRKPAPAPLPAEGEAKKAAPKAADAEKQPAPPPKKDLVTAVKRRVDTVEIQNAMKQIGFAYLNYSETAGKRTPKDREELAPFYENNNQINRFINDGDIVVAFGTIPPGPDDRSKTPFAWEPSQDFTNQRIVLMFDGSIAFVTEADFQALPKAKARK